MCGMLFSFSILIFYQYFNTYFIYHGPQMTFALKLSAFPGVVPKQGGLTWIQWPVCTSDF